MQKRRTENSQIQRARKLDAPHFLFLKRHFLLDFGNGAAGVQALGTRPRAVENGVATVEAHAVLKGLLTLGLLLVAGVGEPAVRLQQDGGAQVLLRVPPVGGARGRAAEAQNALVETVELLAVLLALAVFATLRKQVSIFCLLVVLSVVLSAVLSQFGESLQTTLTSGAGVSLCRYGLMDLYCLYSRVRSGTRSLTT